jgi:flagellar basal-body rod protein FlgG
MYRGMYTAASSLLRMQRRQEAISINLANATSTGYRADKPASDGFATVLQEQMDGVEPPVARGIFGYSWIGEVGSGVEPDRFAIDTSQGAIRQSDNPLDLAIAGDGFFAIQTPTGVAYTRDGAFGRAADGTLVTQQGYPVLGQNGPIALGAGDVTVGRDGAILQNGQAVGQLRIVDFAPRYELPGVDGPVRLPAGDYDIAADGLVSRQGEPIAQLGAWQSTSAAGQLTLAPARLTVGADGAATLDGQPAGRLNRAFGLGPDQARKAGGSLLTVTDGAEAPEPIAGEIRQFALEGSNVDLTRTMTDMLAVQRAYEASQRALRLADEAARRAVDDVGRLGG